MRRRGFTMIELLIAILILGTVTSLSVMTFSAISSAWTHSTEYLDKTQRSDYALEQVVSGLKSMYFPHDGQSAGTDYTYGFYLTDNGEGEDPDESDVIEWAKMGSAIIGNQNASADTVHRVQLMVLEEGNRDYKEPIEVTGLYARLCPDPALRPKRDKNVSEIDYTFANADMYQPVLIADGIVGFNCRVMTDPDKAGTGTDDPQFDDEWATSNQVPYKVELTFWLSDPDGKSYRTNTAPIMRIVRIPVFEQSQDRAALPGDDKGAGGARRGGNAGGGNAGGGNAGGGKPGVTRPGIGTGGAGGPGSGGRPGPGGGPGMGGRPGMGGGPGPGMGGGPMG